jgi:hypothetical protein
MACSRKSFRNDYTSHAVGRSGLLDLMVCLLHSPHAELNDHGPVIRGHRLGPGRSYHEIGGRPTLVDSRGGQPEGKRAAVRRSRPHVLKTGAQVHFDRQRIQIATDHPSLFGRQQLTQRSELVATFVRQPLRLPRLLGDPWEILRRVTDREPAIPECLLEFGNRRRSPAWSIALPP